MRRRSVPSAIISGGHMLRNIVATTVIFLCLASASATAQPKPSAHTTYNSDGDYFHTKGEVSVNVPYTTLGRIAADFARYREWGLHEINKTKTGTKYSIIFNDVVYLKGGRGGKGIFRIFFDLDWPWPLGDKNKQLDFAILEAEPNGKGGIKRLLIDIEKKGALLKTFRLDLIASGNTKASKVTFESKVKFNGFVDTFFSLARFRENIEYRIIKVIQNLQREAEQTGSANSKANKTSQTKQNAETVPKSNDAANTTGRSGKDEATTEKSPNELEPVQPTEQPLSNEREAKQPKKPIPANPHDNAKDSRGATPSSKKVSHGKTEENEDSESDIRVPSDGKPNTADETTDSESVE